MRSGLLVDDGVQFFETVDELLVDKFQLIVFGDDVSVRVLEFQHFCVIFGVELVDSFACKYLLRKDLLLLSDIWQETLELVS